MALRRFDVPDWQRKLLEKLPADQRAVALRTGLPALAAAIEDFKTPGLSSRFDLSTALTVVSCIFDLEVLETVRHCDSRITVSAAAAERIALLFSERNRPVQADVVQRDNDTVDHTDAILASGGGTLGRANAIKFLRGTLNYDHDKVASWYRLLPSEERTELCESLRSDTCQPLCRLFAADIADGSISPADTDLALGLVYDHYQGPVTKAVADLLVSGNASWGGSQLQALLKRLEMTAEALELFEDASRFDLLYFSGVDNEAILNRALAASNAHQSAKLLTVVRSSDLGFFAPALLDAALASGALPYDYQWNHVARRACHAYSHDFAAVVALLRAAPASEFVDAVEKIAFRDQELDVLVDALRSGNWTSQPSDLLACVGLSAQSEKNRVFAQRLLNRSPGVLVRSPLWLRGWLVGMFADLLANRLGADETKWRLAWSLMGQFPGTLPELFDTVEQLSEQS